MVMSLIFSMLLAVSVIFSVLLGNHAELASAVPTGAQNAVTLALSMAGSVCLWTGVGKLMEKAGVTRWISTLLRPILKRVFPSTEKDPVLAGHLSANICANILGLGNAATPMGILAVKRMRNPKRPGYATDEMCRIIVLNTASIQLIPANVAAIRAALGCPTPFDILPSVWITSICSAGAGLLIAVLLGRLCRHD